MHSGQAWRSPLKAVGRLAMVITLLAGSPPAFAQTGEAPAAPRPDVAPFLSPQSGPTQAVTLNAVFAGENKPVRSGLIWRVYRDDDNGQPVLTAKVSQPTPTLQLAPGTYTLHAAYGFAGASKRVVLRGGTPIVERLAIGAGGLRLGAAIGEQPIPASRLSFSVYVPVGSNSEGRLLASNLKAGETILVPEGTYHVVSNYGDTNSIMRADLRVDSGRVTQATLNHRAATITLKLVTQAGGEALAGTAFSVLTPGGDAIREAIGAFPQLVLAEGDYVVIARQDGQVYTLEFKVQSGLDRDIEVLAR